MFGLGKGKQPLFRDDRSFTTNNKTPNDHHQILPSILLLLLMFLLLFPVLLLVAIPFPYNPPSGPVYLCAIAGISSDTILSKERERDLFLSLCFPAFFLLVSVFGGSTNKINQQRQSEKLSLEGNVINNGKEGRMEGISSLYLLVFWQIANWNGGVHQLVRFMSPTEKQNHWRIDSNAPFLNSKMFTINKSNCTHILITIIKCEQFCMN